MSTALAVHPDTLVNFIERAARDPEIDIGKMEALLRMQREVMREQARREFDMAMSAAQAEMEPVVRDAQNEQTRSRYARLETIDTQMRPIYTRHGFSVRYGAAEQPRDGWIKITCTVAHAGGHSEVHCLDSPLDSAGVRGVANKTAVQSVGSAITYLRRYLLCMVFNIVLTNEDDDGEAAGFRRATPQPKDVAQPHDPTAPEYPLATTRGGRIYRTGTEWINAWTGYPNGIINRCKVAGLLDKLQAAREMNAGPFAQIAEFDPQAVAEVRSAIAEALGDTAAGEQATAEALGDEVPL